ncbi:hypothetical protein D6827_00975 [Candidatus Parcubacteria bacterium]|nr:MAG: hypothetical protein D6827_00975 [Candidatus Parcubacteria bacterium]
MLKPAKADRIGKVSIIRTPEIDSAAPEFSMSIFTASENDWRIKNVICHTITAGTEASLFYIGTSSEKNKFGEIVPDITSDNAIIGLDIPKSFIIPKGQSIYISKVTRETTGTVVSLQLEVEELLS